MYGSDMTRPARLSAAASATRPPPRGLPHLQHDAVHEVARRHGRGPSLGRPPLRGRGRRRRGLLCRRFSGRLSKRRRGLRGRRRRGGGRRRRYGARGAALRPPGRRQGRAAPPAWAADATVASFKLETNAHILVAKAAKALRELPKLESLDAVLPVVVADLEGALTSAAYRPSRDAHEVCFFACSIWILRSFSSSASTSASSAAFAAAVSASDAVAAFAVAVAAAQRACAEVSPMG